MSMTVTKLLDGPRHSIFHYAIESEVADSTFILIDPQADIFPTSYKLTVEELKYDWMGFDAKIHFDSDLVGGTMTWVLPQLTHGGVDFRPFGGFKDRSGINGDGKLRLTTYGLTAMGRGTLIVRVRKDGEA